MTTNTWLSDERSVLVGTKQAALLALAGTRRPLALAVTSAIFALLIVAALFLTAQSYSSTVVLRMTEADRDGMASPSPRRKLAEYVRDGVFTSAALLPLMRRFSLYPSLFAKNPRAALDSFREDIDVEVRDNYFLQEPSPGSPPRSARLSLRFHGRDPRVTVEVARALAELVVEHENQVRAEEAAKALRTAQRDVDAAEQALAERRGAIFARTSAASDPSAKDPTRLVELVGLVGSLPSLERRRDVMARRVAKLSLGAALESRHLGMSFEIVDDGALSTAVERRSRRVQVAAWSFLLGLPLVAMAVGAFGRKELAHGV